MKRKLSEIMNDIYTEDLLEIEPVPVNEEQIKSKVFGKLGLSPDSIHDGVRTFEDITTPAFRTIKGGKSQHRFLKVAAVVLAALILVPSAAYAANTLYEMIRQSISYFEQEGSGQTPVNGPTYHSPLAMDVEQYNAKVGYSVESDGKTVTLDSVAIDDNFINAFFTINYDEAINLDEQGDDYSHFPAYSKIRDLTPFFSIEINGERIQGGFSTIDEYDPYMVDDKTVKMMIRIVTPTIFPDEFDLSLLGQNPSSKDIDYRFDLSIDKSASAAATRSVESGLYQIGEKSLDLEKLAVTPFGSVISVKGHMDEDGINPDPNYLMPGDLHIVDNTGKVMHSFWNNAMSGDSSYYALELIGGSPDAESVTLTPVKHNRDRNTQDSIELRSYSVNDIGVKIELSPIGGYNLEDYKVENKGVSITLRPYGVCNYEAHILLDDDQVSLTDMKRKGLINQQIDRKTGLFTFSIDYYAATLEELQSISTFEIPYQNGVELDNENAITLPLKVQD